MLKILAILLSMKLVSTDSEVVCPEAAPASLPDTYADGKWFLTYASNLTGRHDACGLFNTVEPCKCMGMLINSTQTPPITHYTLTNFGYNEEYNIVSDTALVIKVDNSSDKEAVFNAEVPLAGVSFPITLIGTDEYSSWMAVSMCEVIKLNEDSMEAFAPAWIFTRSPFPKESLVEEAMEAVLNNTNLDPLSLIQIKQGDCPQSL